MHLSLLLLSFLLYLSVPASSEYFYYDCYSTGNYTTNSTYLSNLNLLFSSLRSNSTANGFADGTVGTAPDMVTGISLCRGDLNTSSCLSCLSRISDILNLCPYYKSALMWYNSCYMYFSSKYFLSSLANSPVQPLINADNVTVDPDRFDRTVAQFMLDMKSWALNNSTKFFATGIITNFSTEFSTFYGLVQCTPDLTKSQCQSCLQNLLDEFPKYASRAIGARIIGIHCNIRYESAPFYEGPAMVQLDGTAPSQSPVAPPGVNNGTKKKSNVAAFAISIPVVAAVASLAIFCFCFYKKRSHGRKKSESEEVNFEKNIENVDSLFIDLSILKSATNNFHVTNRLGEGGFGAVYKGVLPNGQEVAVKRLSQSSGQGIEELKNELVLVAKLQHKNLVRVVGVCLGGQEKLLVYEFVLNGSLDTFLFDNERRPELDWIKRWRIINGVARGLQYLHEDSQLTIVHRDLKASNILLDSDMNPKISDFGLARLFHVDQTAYATKRVVGTYGYMAPEYAMHGLYSIKSDVFSFGVLLLEIITGTANTGSFDGEHGEDLLSSVWEHWITGTIADIVDPVLDCPTNEIIRHVHIGLLCVQEDPVDRPRMSEVVIMLSTDTISLEAPSKPAFYLKRGDESNTQSVTDARSLQLSQNEVTVSQLGPR
ncbi:cysteine-rich RECEPTOR-like kinase [Rhynchospora pubera]|uniref:Cysteine-rich RECEPTOR-like kinase n=1 Tax=Rhynchospora pubera TaxID=906938 RepID=A0AAV8H6B7_9POAL|nr:cysteine-rich RECEPTOR-like kinase [Rhynchospora pubera]